MRNTTFLISTKPEVLMTLKRNEGTDISCHLNTIPWTIIKPNKENMMVELKIPLAIHGTGSCPVLRKEMLSTSQTISFRALHYTSYSAMN